jgi:hydroxyacyl-ACP dehydratase HTD2-like protein with hotdog domain
MAATDMDHGHGEELKVTFFPPLYLQRRIWVLNMLRQHGVTSVRATNL